jgi:predicted aconitase
MTPHEREMLEGRQVKASQKAIERLVRYAEALGAERFVDTRNVAGVPGSALPVPVILAEAMEDTRQIRDS